MRNTYKAYINVEDSEKENNIVFLICVFGAGNCQSIGGLSAALFGWIIKIVKTGSSAEDINKGQVVKFGN